MFKRLVIAVLMVMLASPVMAGVVPTGECDPEWGCPGGTTGIYSKDDMGEFVGNVWVWAEDFVAAADPQFQSANPNWQEAWKPTMEEGGISIDKNTYLMKRAYADPAKPASSVAYVTVTNKAASINVPRIWGAGCTAQVCTGDPMFPECFGEEVECPVVYDPDIQYNFMMACNPCGTGADGVEFDTVESSTPDESLEVVSVEWDGDMAVQRPYPTSPLFE
jgi:hypothetical protein